MNDIDRRVADTPVYPVQCKCGHLFLERYTFREPADNGVHGFCWCGFCRTRVDVKAPADAGEVGE